MPYNVVADSFHTKKLCSRLISSSKVQFYLENGRFAFLSPFGVIKGGTMFILGLSENAYSRFPISVYWTFWLGATGEALRANIEWESAISLHREPVYPKFQIGVALPSTILLLRKLG